MKHNVAFGDICHHAAPWASTLQPWCLAPWGLPSATARWQHRAAQDEMSFGVTYSKRATKETQKWQRQKVPLSQRDANTHNHTCNSTKLPRDTKTLFLPFYVVLSLTDTPSPMPAHPRHTSSLSICTSSAVRISATETQRGVALWWRHSLACRGTHAGLNGHGNVHVGYASMARECPSAHVSLFGTVRNLLIRHTNACQFSRCVSKIWCDISSYSSNVKTDQYCGERFNRLQYQERSVLTIGGAITRNKSIIPCFLDR